MAWERMEARRQNSEFRIGEERLQMPREAVQAYSKAILNSGS